MSEDGFSISNLDELDQLLKNAKKGLPRTIENLMESLGEELLNLAKENMRSGNFAHSVFKKSQNKITRGKNKGKNRISIKHSGSTNRNLVDQGGLWNSLQRGGRGNIWEYSGASGTFKLKVGSSLKYAKWVHDGYTVKKDHWVPGVVDSNGIFRYQKGAKSGIMAKARTFEGVPFLEVSLKDLEAIVPDLVKQELQALFGGMAT